MSGIGSGKVGLVAGELPAEVVEVFVGAGAGAAGVVAGISGMESVAVVVVLPSGFE